MTLPLVLDLFSGTGSATQPFVECGKHRVVRIDIAGKPDVRADVRHLPIGDVPVEFIWASPPCESFSSANAFTRDPEKGMLLVRAAWKAIQALEPTNWALENVHASIPHISRLLGPPVFKEGAYKLWGTVSPTGVPILRKGARLKQAVFYRHTRRNTWFLRKYSNPLPGSAAIPLPLAQAVHRAVCEAP